MGISQHPLLCIRTTTLVNYLFHLKCSHTKNTNGSHPPLAIIRRLHKYIFHYIGIGKTIFYVLSIILILRAFYCVALMLNKPDHTPKVVLTTHLPYNPLIVICATRYGFFNAPILASVTLSVIWCIFFDFAFTYLQNNYQLILTYQLMITNGQHIWTLNERRLGKNVSQWPMVNQWLPKLAGRFIPNCIFLGRVWKATFDQPKTLRFINNPILNNFSKHLRGRCIVYNAVFEAAVVCLNLGAGMFSLFCNNIKLMTLI